MKLTVLVSSGQYLASAGNRIRYQRLRNPLSKLGISLETSPIDSLKSVGNFKPGDVFVLSKIQDARGLALAHELRAKGLHVGVDLFDDYFSQSGDARFAPQRLWLSHMAKIADFFLCSTPRMHEIAKAYFGRTSGHVINDPFGRFEPERLHTLIEGKRLAALETRTLRLAWFGMGDNPNFSVGLHDLVRYSQSLDGFRRGGFEVQLKVLTNLRALDAQGLKKLKGLRFRPLVEEWSEEQEHSLLEDSLVAFLPVNGQGFSVAKSLNRAVTALTSGAQVLSAGFPLYEPLSAFLYRRSDEIVADIGAGNLRLGGSRLEPLRKQLDELSNPEVEASALSSFLKGVVRSSVNRPASLKQHAGESRLAIIHGERTTAGISKFAQRRQWLSLGSPLTPAGISCDAHLSVFAPCDVITLRLNSQAVDWLTPAARDCLHQLDAVHAGFGYELRLEDLGLPIDPVLMHVARAVQEGMAGTRIALQHRASVNAKAIYLEIFGPLEFIDSELNPLLCAGREIQLQAI